MEHIIIEKRAFYKLIDKIKNIEALTEKVNEKKSLDGWMDNQDICFLLDISPRTLQKFRDEKILPFSQKKGKIFYKAIDIDIFLKSNYRKGKK